MLVLSLSERNSFLDPVIVRGQVIPRSTIVKGQVIPRILLTEGKLFPVVLLSEGKLFPEYDCLRASYSQSTIVRGQFVSGILSSEGKLVPEFYCQRAKYSQSTIGLLLSLSFVLTLLELQWCSDTQKSFSYSPSVVLTTVREVWFRISIYVLIIIN